MSEQSDQETTTTTNDNQNETEKTQHNTSMPTLTKKDPRRVEQGKRLAMVSKQAKERKMREKIEQESNTWTQYATTYFFPSVAALSSFSFFYLWFSTRSMEKSMAQDHQEPQVSPKQKPPQKFESLG